MSHVRTQIRDAVADAMLSISGIDTRVFRTRVYPMDKASLPGICVYADSESSELTTIGSSASYVRTLSVQIEVYVRGSTDVDETLDGYSVSVETKMATDSTLADLVLQTVLSSTEIDIVGGDSEKPVGVLKLSYDISYRTNQTDPTAII